MTGAEFAIAFFGIILALPVVIICVQLFVLFWAAILAFKALVVVVAIRIVKAIWEAE